MSRVLSTCLDASALPLLLLLLLQVVPYLVDLLQDSCMAVRRVAGACLDSIMDSNEAAAGATGVLCLLQTPQALEYFHVSGRQARLKELLGGLHSVLWLRVPANVGCHLICRHHPQPQVGGAQSGVAAAGRT
jgi:hypothetical protein